MRKLSFIIVNFNSTTDSLAALDNLSARFARFSPEFVIVDNASSPAERENLAKGCSGRPDTIVVLAERNCGFGTGANLGANRASGAVLVFFNPDASVPFDVPDGFIDDFRAEPCIVGPRITWPDGSFQPSYSRRYSTAFTFFCQFLALGSVYRKMTAVVPPFVIRGLHFVLQILSPEVLSEYLRRLQPVTSAVSCAWVSGACLCMPADAFRKLGGFDTTFFMYSEDEDLCRRAAASGMRVIHDPTLTVVHAVGGTQTGALGAVGSLEFKFASALQYLAKWDPAYRRNALALRIAASLRVVASGLAFVAPRRFTRMITMFWTKS